MKSKYDVIVVGAGYHGCSCAYFLSKAGKKVLLVDKGTVGGGASGANFGNVQVQDCSMGTSFDLTVAGYERMKTMEDELQTSIGYRDRGSLLVADKEACLDGLIRNYEEKKAAGVPVVFLEDEALYEKEPNLRGSGIRYASYMDEGNVYPFHYIYALVRRGRDCGLEVSEKTPVASVLLEGGACRGIILEDGSTVRADHVVLAGGSGTTQLSLTAGFKTPVNVVKAECYATEPIKPFFRNYYSSAGFFSDSQNPNRAAVSLCISQSHYGNLLIAETTKPFHLVGEAYHDCTSIDHLKGITAELLRVFPALKDIQILRSWVTAAPYTSDHLPYFGRSPVEGLLLAAGFKSSVVVSAGVGETIRDLIVKDSCRFDLKEFTDRSEVV